MKGTCHHCRHDFPDAGDLRPYGPGGAMVCYGCAMATPERAATAKAALDAALDSAMSHGHVLLSLEHGPVPLSDELLVSEIRKAKAES